MIIVGQSQFILKYELTPISVVYSLQKVSLLEFLVQLCAVIGGFFTVASIVEALIS